MRKPIAVIRINAGNPGWYDPLTNIHLTIPRPQACVYEGANTTNIKKGVFHGLVHIVEGSLEMEPAITEPVVKEEVREVAPQVEEKTEEIKAEEPAIEEVIEAEPEAKEEVVEEKPKAKKTATKKKATKKDAE